MCQAVLRSKKEAVFRVVDSTAMSKSFERYVRMFSDKTVSTMKSTALVAYSVHVLLLNVSRDFCRCLVENGTNVAGFLPLGETGGGRSEEQRRL